MNVNCMHTHTHTHTLHTHTALAVHGKSITPPPRVNVKELAKLYKQRSLESLGRGRKGKLKCVSFNVGKNLSKLLVLLCYIIYMRGQ